MKRQTNKIITETIVVNEPHIEGVSWFSKLLLRVIDYKLTIDKKYCKVRRMAYTMKLTGKARDLLQAIYVQESLFERDMKLFTDSSAKYTGELLRQLLACGYVGRVSSVNPITLSKSSLYYITPRGRDAFVKSR